MNTFAATHTYIKMYKNKKARRQTRLKLSLGLASILLVSFCQGQEYHWPIVNKKFDSIAAILDTMGNFQAHWIQVEGILNQMEEISIKENIPVLRARYRYWKEVVSEEGNATKSADEKYQYFNETLLYIDRTQYDYDYARILLVILEQEYNLYTSYLDMYKQLLDISVSFHKHQDYEREGDCYRRIAVMFYQIGEPQQSLDYLDKADYCFERAGEPQRVVFNRLNRAVSLYYMGLGDSAIKILKDMLNYPFIKEDARMPISIYHNLSLISPDSNERQHYLNLTLEQSRKYSGHEDAIYVESVIANNIAGQQLDLGHVDSALELFQTALDKASQIKAPEIQLSALGGLAACYNQKKDSLQAYRYTLQRQMIEGSIRSQTQLAEINRKEAGTLIDEYQQRLALQNQKIQLQKRITILLATSVCLIIISLSGFALYLRQKKRVAEISMENKELQNQKLQQEVDSQNRELSSNMLLMNENRKFLQQLLAYFEKLREKGKLSNPDELELRKMVSNHINSENEWEAFKIHFEKVHPNFFQKLKGMHPNLTSNDLKLCSYIRINLSIKQMAEMTAVLPDTIKTSRYRLKNKLRLEDSQNLDEYIASV